MLNVPRPALTPARGMSGPIAVHREFWLSPLAGSAGSEVVLQGPSDLGVFWGKQFTTTGVEGSDK